MVGERLLTLAALFLLWSVPVSGHPLPVSWQDHTFTEIVPQTADWDCGPAAIQTILSLLDWPEIHPEKPTLPVHMAHLQDIFTAAGLTSQGFRLRPEHLWLYFEGSNPVPMVVHLQWPEPHFSVLAASWQHWLLLADPGIGWRWIARTEFLSLWTGYVLLPDPPRPWQQPAIIHNLVTRLQSLAAAKHYF